MIQGIDYHIIRGHKITKEALDKADQIGLKLVTIKSRIKRGWSVEKALTEPLQKTGRPKGIKNNGERHRRYLEQFRKDDPDSLKLMIGRIKYMQTQDLLIPPVVTKRMKKRAEEYGIDIEAVRMVPVDVSDLRKKGELPEGEKMNYEEMTRWQSHGGTVWKIREQWHGGDEMITYRSTDLEEAQTLFHRTVLSGRGGEALRRIALEQHVGIKWFDDLGKEIPEKKKVWRSVTFGEGNEPIYWDEEPWIEY